MNDGQWQTLLAVIRGDDLHPVPTGFIIDSPWLPNWAGHTILDYFTDDRTFLDDNWAAIDAFPQAIFLPGFWSEYGMTTEPSAFGSVPVWEPDEFPFAKKCVRSVADIDALELPDPRKHGLLPLAIKRYQHALPEMEKRGHQVRFATARGPLNIATFLMGATEFLTAIKTDPEAAHRLLTIVTDFLVSWIAYQRESFPTIDGVLLLDDIIGFVGRRDFETFGLPYFQRAYDTDVTVKFLHNDAPAKASAPLLAEAGVNFLNFGIQHTISEMREWTGGKIAILGNVPPRDVLRDGTPEEVERSVAAMLEALDDRSRLMVSAGGGMSPGTPTANIRALIATTERLTC